MISKESFFSALKEVDNAILATLPDPHDCSFQFSTRFEKKMRSVVRHGNHPVIYKALQRVACILLVLFMLFSGVMIVNTEVRASVIGWIKEQYETFYHYFFPAETTATEQIEYTLGWIPDGYTLASSYSSDSIETTVYFHSSGNMIQFSYLYGSEKITDFVVSKDYDHYEVAIKGSTAEIFIASSPNKANGILWEDETRTVFFSISAPLKEPELVRLAESVIRK